MLNTAIKYLVYGQRIHGLRGRIMEGSDRKRTSKKFLGGVRMITVWDHFKRTYVFYSVSNTVFSQAWSVQNAVYYSVWSVQTLRLHPYIPSSSRDHIPLQYICINNIFKKYYCKKQL